MELKNVYRFRFHLLFVYFFEFFDFQVSTFVHEENRLAHKNIDKFDKKFSVFTFFPVFFFFFKTCFPESQSI